MDGLLVLFNNPITSKGAALLFVIGLIIAIVYFLVEGSTEERILTGIGIFAAAVVALYIYKQMM